MGGSAVQDRINAVSRVMRDNVIQSAPQMVRSGCEVEPYAGVALVPAQRRAVEQREC